MSSYLYIRCECGKRLADQISIAFERAVLRDNFGCLARFGIWRPPVPWGPTGDDFLADAKEFVDWHDYAMSLLRAGEDLLPTLQTIWLRSRAGGAQATVAPFEWEGRAFLAKARDDPAITVTEVDRKVFAKTLAYMRPRGLQHARRLERMGPRELITTGDGTMVMAAELFEYLFAGTGLFLKRAPLLAYYAHGFGQLLETAEHARSCGRTLRMFYV